MTTTDDELAKVIRDKIADMDKAGFVYAGIAIGRDGFIGGRFIHWTALLQKGLLK